MEASELDSVKWRRVKSRVSQLPERRKEKEGERVSCGVWRQWLVEAGLEPEASAWYENRQSSVRQPSLRFNSAGRELLPPTKKKKKKNLHSHLLPLLLHASPYPSHTPFHSPTASPFTQPHFQTDQMGSVHPTVCCHRHHCNATGLLSCFTSKYSFAKVTAAKPAWHWITVSRSNSMN